MSEVTKFREEGFAGPGELSQQDSAVGLIKRVGKRVRRARESKSVTRQALSHLSGVSQRYLAQLEAGEGNVSIALLQRVSDALNHRIEWLVGEDDPWTSEALHVADLYRQADRKTREAVRRRLQPGASARAQRLCLIGLRGAGKSTLGALVAPHLDLPFIELNSEIEDQSGMAVAEVLALYGQEGYRQLEAQALDRLISTHENLILAAAGGIVSEPNTYKQLLSHFHTVWVKALPEEHMARVRAQGDERPMAGNPEAMEQLRSILTSREGLYAQADATLVTSGKKVEESLEELLVLINAQGFLGRQKERRHEQRRRQPIDPRGDRHSLRYGHHTRAGK